MTLKQPTLPEPKHPLDRVAFAGPMCSGKTTLANVLVEDFGYHRVNFAGLLKKTVKKLYGVVNKNDEGRQLLQEFADDLKKWDPNLFTTHLLIDIEERILQDNYETFVVDDLRFKHEYEALKKNGFTIVGVACREDERMKRIFSLYPDTNESRLLHPSEIGWKEMKMDYWIDNTGPSGETSVHDLIMGSVGK